MTKITISNSHYLNLVRSLNLPGHQMQQMSLVTAWREYYELATTHTGNGTELVFADDEKATMFVLEYAHIIG